MFIDFDGAPTRTRTADLLITNQLLYQLSYRGRVDALLANAETRKRKSGHLLQI